MSHLFNFFDYIKNDYKGCEQGCSHNVFGGCMLKIGGISPQSVTQPLGRREEISPLIISSPYFFRIKNAN